MSQRLKAWIAGTALTVLCLLPAAAARAERVSMPDSVKRPECEKVDSAVTVDEVWANEDVVTAKGTYSVKNGDGALIEFRIEGDRYEAQYHPGASGTWTFDHPNQACGHHAARVFVYPSIHDAKGFSMLCLPQGVTERGQYDIPCNPRARVDSCAWSCGEGAAAACTAKCSVSAAAGYPPYLPYYGLDGVWESEAGGPATSAWEHEFACRRGQEVFLRVKDRTGVWSPVVKVRCGGEAKP